MPFLFQEYSTDTIVSRKITFIPDATAINGLSAGDVRYATITIKTMRNATEVDSETFSVAIYTAMHPVFSIEAVTDSVNEAGTAQFKATTTSDPGTGSHSAMFTATNIKGSYLKTADLNTSKPVSLTFTADQQQNPTSWTSNTFDLALRADNSTDEENGDNCTVSLDRATGDISSATFTTDPNSVASVAVKDLTVPVITFTDATAIQAPADAVFTFTATPKPWQPLSIRYKPTNETGSFLDTTDGASGVIRTINPKLTFTDSGNNGTATLNLSTIIDTDNASGEISVEISGRF